MLYSYPPGPGLTGVSAVHCALLATIQQAGAASRLRPPCDVNDALRFSLELG